LTVRDFAALFDRIDQAAGSNQKVGALASYFREAPAGDSAWALALLSGRRPKGLVKRSALIREALALSGLPEWLFEECRSAAGDTAEAIARILPDGAVEGGCGSLEEWMQSRVLALKGLGEPEQAALIRQAWSELTGSQRLVYNKLITGGFRLGLSRELAQRAAAEALAISRDRIARATMGEWEPGSAFWKSLAEPEPDAGLSRPFPFCLAHPLPEPEALGDPTQWQAEWKWDGIRCQLLRSEGRTWLWSRGEELLMEAFPDIAAIGDGLPEGAALDGEIMIWQEGPRPFAELQKRIGRRAPGPKLLREHPAAFLAFDLLAEDGADIRSLPLSERRARLEALISGRHARLLSAPAWSAASLDELARARSQARSQGCEGLMLKRLDSAYEPGRRSGIWWKWKVDPHSVDAVLTAAQRGSGRRAGLYTDYTFALWRNGELTTFAKAYSGLSDAEIRRVDAFVRAHTLESFGPVRTVEPRLVFEIGFEGLQPSRRHKSGWAVRFPRILRWREDKGPQDADLVEALAALANGTDAVVPGTLREG
jgi:DNA ligase-1